MSTFSNLVFYILSKIIYLAAAVSISETFDSFLNIFRLIEYTEFS